MENHQFRKEDKKKKMELQSRQKTTNKTARVNPYLSITTLNLNELNPFKSHRVAEWIF